MVHGLNLRQVAAVVLGSELEEVGESEPGQVEERRAPDEDRDKETAREPPKRVGSAFKK
jgi:hypothetical protein